MADERDMRDGGNVVEMTERQGREGVEATQPGVIGPEEFDLQAKPMAARIATLTKRVGRLGRLPRHVDEWDVFSATKVADEVAAVVDELSQEVGRFGDVVRSTRIAATDADEARWASEFEQALSLAEVPFAGRYPQYDVFPFYVKVDLKGGAAVINNRTGHVLRPAALAKLVRAEWEKVHRAAFNDQQFLKALYALYDVLPKNLTRGVALRRAHELLTVRIGTAAYPLRQFAFDLYRLRRTNMTADGRRLVLNPSRDKKGVSVPDGHGGTDLLGTYEVVRA